MVRRMVALRQAFLTDIDGGSAWQGARAAKGSGMSSWQVSVRNWVWFTNSESYVRLSSQTFMEDWHGKAQGQQGVVG